MKSSRIVTLAILAMVVFGGAETAFADTSYSFTTIDVPGAGVIGTTADGINNSGQIVGTSGDHGQIAEGFLFTLGSLATIAVPGAGLTQALGINDSGQVLGTFRDFDLAVAFGFLDMGGSFTLIDVPGLVSPKPRGSMTAARPSDLSPTPLV